MSDQDTNTTAAPAPDATSVMDAAKSEGLAPVDGNVTIPGTDGTPIENPETDKAPEPQSVLDALKKGDDIQSNVPEAYAFEGDYADVSETMQSKLSSIWKEAGLSQEQAVGELERMQAMEQFVKEQHVGQVSQYREEFKSSRTTDQYREDLLTMGRAFEHFMTPDQQKFIAENGLDWNPLFAPLWINLGKMASDAKTHTGITPPQRTKDIQDTSYESLRAAGYDIPDDVRSR